MADGAQQQLANALQQINVLSSSLQAERRETALRRELDEMKAAAALDREKREREIALEKRDREVLELRASLREQAMMQMINKKEIILV